MSQFYLGLVGPFCSFLTNISFSLICFLFPLIIVIPRYSCQAQYSWRGHCVVPPGRECSTGWFLLITFSPAHYTTCQGSSRLPSRLWLRLAVIAAAGGRYYQQEVSSRTRYWKVDGSNQPPLALPGLHPRRWGPGSADLSGSYWEYDKQNSIPPPCLLYLAMIGVFIELSLLLWYINVSARPTQHKIRFLIVFWTIVNVTEHCIAGRAQW